ASGKCVSGGCQLDKCAAGYADCNKSDGDGCEINTRTSSNNCGACGTTCQNNNAVNGCTGGTCVPTCSQSYFKSCDSDPNNGCETDLRWNKPNCGACGVVWADNPPTSNDCASSAGAPSCQSGYADCDTSRANGCETPTSADPSNCGGCNVH